ncbi:plastocyanin/azurin family copper-binding protein [Planococcus chinensis]|uniref:Plastocyanin/azurin family copper-binding protein n=1 Tax=Planococcus chinensis TaxID=272917 RepID=A0ABW4QKR1_9BACL
MGRTWWILLLSVLLALSACGEEEGGGAEAPAGVPEAQEGEVSEIFPPGEEVAFFFGEPGRFDVYCPIHPAMEMTVMVKKGADISGETTIAMKDLAFSERSVTVAPGTTVTWVNEDTLDHNVGFK